MIKRRRFRKLANHHAEIDDNGKPRRTVVTIPQENDDRELIVENCSNIIVRGAAVKGWQAAGDVMNGKPYAIDIREGCKNIDIEKPVIIGSPDDSSRKAWRESASNGLIVREGNTDINILQPSISGVHYGADLRADIGTLIGGEIHKVSADNICGRGNGWTVDGPHLHTSIEAVSYDELHRDKIQVYHKGTADNPQFIQDWLVQNCRFGVAEILHKLAKPGQIFLVSDGVAKNIRFIDNHIITRHDLIAVMTVCIGGEIKHNKIWTIGDLDPQIRVHEGRYGIKSESVDIDDNPIKSWPQEGLFRDNVIYAPRESKSSGKAVAYDDAIVITENNQVDFAEFVAKCRNKKAPALTQQDYIAAGKRLNIGALMIKAFFQVESIRTGYLPDGSLKGLLERHWVHKLSRRRGVLQSILQSAGMANCNVRPGGYQGGKAEYFRARTVCDSGEPEALDIALSSMSIGLPQIMGFNYKEAGYNSPREMFEHMHLSEKNQLDAFCSFIESKGLVPLLQKAEERLSAGKRSGKYLAKVAEIYNGKKHKQYDLKIARAYRVLAEAENEIVIKPKRKSNTLQGAAVSTTGNVGAGVSVAVLLSQLQSAREVAESTASKLQTEVDALKDQAAEPNYMMWLVFGFILLSQSGAIVSGLARLRDRFTGKNP